MRSYLKTVLVAGFALALAACRTAGGAPPTTLYDDLGGKAGVGAIVGGMLDYSLADDRIAHTFENSNVERVEGLIIEQVCDLAGGPCEYTGQTMERSHRGLGLTTLHFNALVENLQRAMRDNAVPYRTQNRLIAVLAPMHGDVVGD